MKEPGFPNESAAYRQARQRLLEAEAALRRQVEAVAALRRTLPLGGTIKEDYVFEELDPGGAVRRVRLSELFATGQNSLLLYGYMFGPAMPEPCPMCTSFLDGLNGNARHITRRMSLAVVARSPIQRIAEVARSRGWKALRLLSSAGCTYHADYFAEDPEGNQWPMANVFVRRDGDVRHFWGSELLFRPFEGGDMRHLDVMWPLWNVLDLTPEGRSEKWYPALDDGD